MQCKCFASIFAAVGIAGIVGSIALTQPAKDKKTDKQPAPAAQPADQLPPGWTQEDMKSYMDAATPGPMHAHLNKGIGTWTGKSLMWPAPGAEPTKSETTSVVTGLMDGKFVQVNVSGDIPGMGPFHGLGINGYDNVAKKFVSSWVDNMGTTMMIGTGELSANGKTLTWNYTFTCPIQKKAVAMRQVETSTGPNSMTLEMFGPEPKTGVEFKMMQIEMTRK